MGTIITTENFITDTILQNLLAQYLEFAKDNSCTQTKQVNWVCNLTTASRVWIGVEEESNILEKNHKIENMSTDTV